MLRAAIGSHKGRGGWAAVGALKVIQEPVDTISDIAAPPTAATGLARPQWPMALPERSEFTSGFGGQRTLPDLLLARPGCERPEAEECGSWIQFLFRHVRSRVVTGTERQAVG